MSLILLVLAYLPNKNTTFDYPTEFPEGIETIPKKFSIDFRNRWMLKQADTVIAYITHDWGGAAKFVEQAVRQKKTVLNLADKDIML